MSNYKAEIIAVGTELLLGQITNTNAQWLSERLAEQGLNVYYHGVVGDNFERVKTTFLQANDRSDIVIVTGGLGPTDDDLTREAFQAVANLSVYEDKSTMDKIISYYNKSKKQMTPNNRKQSLVFEGATVLSNSAGMAPGMIVEYNQVIWVFMPGVPKEMKAITTEHVMPFLKEKLQLSTVIESRMLRFIGIGESQLEHDLKQLILDQKNPTIAPLASEGEVAIRITAKADSSSTAKDLIDSTEKKILEIAGDHFYGHDQDTIQTKVFNRLKETQQTIAAAESLTGGRFTDELISIPGASEVCMGGVVCYSKHVKQTLLRVSKQTLDTHGTVSQACATELAQNVQHLLGADIGISFTGVAGPSVEEGKPVGKVFISIYNKSGNLLTKECHFQGNRDAIRNRAVKKGFELLYQQLNQ
ncbi:competence/damage-inducible protein A [Radiobacillus sp. PE A8.2]|uniref:competence/damage-inducible protein A n=1 Tax=Radiobacillus sp. PE A8.2 TaxID=3380349 RepID=UPI00389115FE